MSAKQNHISNQPSKSKKRVVKKAAIELIIDERIIITNWNWKPTDLKDK